MDFCFLLYFKGPVDFLLILIPIEMGKITGEFFKIILIGRMIHDCKINPAEHVFFFHAMKIKFF